jgi:hypothetical protein
MIRVAPFASRLAPTVEMPSNAGASLLAKEPVLLEEIPDQRPFFQSHAPIRIPIVHSTAT